MSPALCLTRPISTCFQDLSLYKPCQWKQMGMHRHRLEPGLSLTESNLEDAGDQELPRGVDSCLAQESGHYLAMAGELATGCHPVQMR